MSLNKNATANRDRKRNLIHRSKLAQENSLRFYFPPGTLTEKMCPLPSLTSSVRT
jgi:hypothetical protein